MSESEIKKFKLEGKEGVNLLNSFEFVKVLNENNLSKLMIILALKKNQSENNNAVIIFEKPHFAQDDINSLLALNSQFEMDIQNDIYNKFKIFPLYPYNNIQVQLIYPATEQHIQKYSVQEMFFVSETIEDYNNLTLKFIEQTQLNLNWVYNILEHKKESERIIFEDPDPVNGFILLPDMKWDGQVDNLYALVIVHQKDILSLRSLTGQHLPLLENLRNKCYTALEEKFGIKREKVRAYVHYQPSFYHFHVHFSHIKYQSPAMPDRNIPLSQVINNLALFPDYYQKSTLEMVIRKNEKLYDLYKHKFE
ncbi:m7 diphosphatase-like [Brachionus plicatilis]|uniref:m7GpppX diphosphatase n=1 Tax=Brachionus plicatilis TaxID=10195 RepID=A0A3M7T6U5_BRAPC|nr:m7 diphosphatase-like [Brachionus plicatilis]